MLIESIIYLRFHYQPMGCMQLIAINMQLISRSLEQTKIKLLIFDILFNLKEIWPKEVKVGKNWISVIDKKKFQDEFSRSSGHPVRCVKSWTMNESFLVFVIILCFIKKFIKFKRDTRNLWSQQPWKKLSKWRKI